MSKAFGRVARVLLPRVLKPLTRSNEGRVTLEAVHLWRYWEEAATASIAILKAYGLPTNGSLLPRPMAATQRDKAELLSRSTEVAIGDFKFFSLPVPVELTPDARAAELNKQIEVDDAAAKVGFASPDILVKLGREADAAYEAFATKFPTGPSLMQLADVIGSHLEVVAAYLDNSIPVVERTTFS